MVRRTHGTRQQQHLGNKWFWFAICFASMEVEASQKWMPLAPAVLAAPSLTVVMLLDSFIGPPERGVRFGTLCTRFFMARCAATAAPAIAYCT